MNQIEHSTAAAEILDVQTGNAVSDLLRRAIERHDAAERYFNSVCYLEEDGILGRAPTPDELALKEAASDASDAAMMEVCYFPARTPTDLAAKGRYLRKYHSNRMGHLEDWQVENLLRSMLTEDERDAIDDSDDDDEDRVIVNVGHLLSEMIEAYGAAHAKICDTEGIADEADVDRMLAIALSIISYRPFTKDDERRKAEFLREYTDATMLTEKEQNALIASMLPEGGDA